MPYRRESGKENVNMLQHKHRYPTGSIVQHSNGYIHVKRNEGGWITEHRFIAELKLAGRELREGERVYHKDGDRQNNKAENLVIIQFNMNRYKVKYVAKPIFIPKHDVANAESIVEARA